MFDFEIAFFMYKMSRIQQIFLDSKYKAKAYHLAGMALDAYNRYVEEMYRNHSLTDIPFIGKNIEKKIIEIFETGNMSELKEYEIRFGITDYSLLLSHGLPDKIIKKLIGKSIFSAYDLLDRDKINKSALDFTKSELKKIKTFIEEFKENNGKYLYSYGKCLGEELVDFLNKVPGINYVSLAMDPKRSIEKIEKIKINYVYSGSNDDFMKHLDLNSRISYSYDKYSKSIEGLTNFGIPFVLIRLDNIPSQAVGNSNYFNKLIMGDLHCHSNWSDGIHSIDQLAKTAEDMGYEYFAVTDHSVSMRFAHGLSETQVLSQIQYIKEFNRQHHLQILAGIEVDILSDGTLDYSNDILSQFDFVIAAIHSNLNQEQSVLYARLNKALSNPYVNILAHPTARLLGRAGVLFSERKPYNINIHDIIMLCKINNVVLEVNCFPERLDLCESHIDMALKQGVKISLGTDSHSLAHMCNISYGIEMLNRLDAEADMVLNTYAYSNLMTFFKHQRKKVVITNDIRPIKMKKDFQYYFGNNPQIMNGEKCIVGIDLTGSESKESGFAYMKSNVAQCKRISSDKEIIGSIEYLRPDIISIDSPLAYPKGRCCSKRTCECSKYGIMRESERLLRHFGITVYPCLIDSMVNLTTRGMQLARELRTLGYTVIESYPGVAQDILMIPRKGKTAEQFQHLKNGLRSFNIKGDLCNNSYISHDEVDAITSALVGYFYLNGQYVAMGNDDEDYLIVPRIQEEVFNKQIIIGLSGETGAGKTTIAQYLKFKYGFEYFRYSKIIEQKYNIKDKSELQKVGANIARNTQEQRDLTRYMIKNMKPRTSYVIDGLRHLEDYDELKKEFNDRFLFVYIDCRYLNRYKRYNKDHLNGISETEFYNIDNHKSEADIITLQLKADSWIDNNKGFNKLREQIDNIIKNEFERKN